MSSGLDDWLSPNPERAWSERFFLLYSPYWMVCVGLVMVTGVIGSWGDVELLAFALAMALPAWLGPYLSSGRPDHDRPVWDTYWFKLNVWVAIVVFIGSYFWSHYFFELMGMHYEFPSTWHLEAEILGKPANQVDFFLYPLTHAYFVSYYTIMVVLVRKVRGVLGDSPAVTVLAIIGVSYVVAFGETFFMNVELLADYFGYASRERMLAVGSIPYALVFVGTLPLVLDMEERPGARWSVGKTVIRALAAGMIGMTLLDFWALVMGPL